MEKVSVDQQLTRLEWLVKNEFLLKPNYEWLHVEGKNMIKHDLVLNSSNHEWERLTDAIEYHLSNA